MDAPHPSHRYLTLPAWAQDEHPSTPTEGLDLSVPARAANPREALLDAIGTIDLASSAYPAMSEVRETASTQLNVPKGSTYIGPGIAYIFRLTCQSTLRPGDHVAICEPTPDWVKRCILAVGAAYVDIGRDWRMNPL